MSLNRSEQAVFDYWTNQLDERRHWQSKVTEAARFAGPTAERARILERELWDYLVERSQHVETLRSALPTGARRVSLLNLAELILRLWAPPPKSKLPPQ